MSEFLIENLKKQVSQSDQNYLVLQRDRFQRPVISINIKSGLPNAEQHDLAQDITHILEGDGTLILGGQLKNKRLSTFYEWRADGIEKGTKTNLLAGKIIKIDPGIPHQIIPDKSITYITYKNYFGDYLEPQEKFDPELLEKIRNIKGLIMDVDGTMTDGKVLVNDKGEEFASFSRIDSLALLPWQGMGNFAGIISREEVSIASARAAKLKIDCVQNIQDKLKASEKMIEGWGLDYSQICFIGDDVNDLPLLKKVGFSACPKDAQPQILDSVDLVIPQKRGGHVIRKLLDLIFQVQLGQYPESYENTKI